MLVGADHPPPPFRTVALPDPEVIVIGPIPPHWRAALGPVTSSALLEFADLRPDLIRFSLPGRDDESEVPRRVFVVDGGQTTHAARHVTCKKQVLLYSRTLTVSASMFPRDRMEMPFLGRGHAVPT